MHTVAILQFGSVSTSSQMQPSFKTKSMHCKLNHQQPIRNKTVEQCSAAAAAAVMMMFKDLR
jgi:hypothetical protein